jgi:geranylgeranyl diphosphate synthase type II
MANPAAFFLAGSASKIANVGLSARIEAALEAAFRTCAAGLGCPPRLAEAQHYALFPGGARLRPQLCLLTAVACGDPHPSLAEAAAASIELLHCASLVHDDLPCFDNADVRRGKASVHKAYGEPLALLVGDAFIVQSFDVLVRAAASNARELPELLQTLAMAAGTSRGLLAGQAWESEPVAPLEEYQRAKTASLFEAASAMGAIAAGAPPQPWRRFASAIGRAYQAADDLRDAVGSAASLGKPTGRDEALKRPSIVRAFGAEAARARVASQIDAALRELPRCQGEPLVREWVAALSSGLGS